jgi:Protein of unknown function (DUF1579)
MNAAKFSSGRCPFPTARVRIHYRNTSQMEVVMNRFAIAGFVLPVVFVALPCHAQELPEMPAPQKEHQWLNQLVGEWDTEGEIYMEPGKPPLKSTGTENARMLGGFWLVCDVNGEFMQMAMEARLTLGYDPEKKKYVGTWVDSMTSYLWNYDGSLDESGKILTLNTEGPCPQRGGQMTEFKEVIEIKNKDERVFSSSMQEEDGKWTTLVKVHYHRKK